MDVNSAKLTLATFRVVTNDFQSRATVAILRESGSLVERSHPVDDNLGPTQDGQ